MIFIVKDWAKKKVLVTGSTGFIGSKLVSFLLNKNALVTGISLHDNKRKNKNYLHLRKSLFDILKLSDFDIIFHLAVSGLYSKNLDDNNLVKVNLNLTKKLLNLIPNPSTTKIVFTSSCSVYEDQVVKVLESTELSLPTNNYAKSKYLSELEIVNFAEKNNMPYSIARLFNVYGLGESNSILSKMIYCLNNDLSMPFNPDLVRDFIDVDEVVKGLEKIALQGNGIYNIGTGKGIMLKNLKYKLEQISAKKLKTKSLSSSLVLESVASIDKVNTLGWFPKNNLDYNLKRLYLASKGEIANV